MGVASGDADLPVRRAERGGRAVLARQARAVANLEAVHPGQRGGDVRGRDGSVDPRRHVVDAREQALLSQVRQQLGDVFSEPLDLAVLRLVEAEHAEVQPDAVFRKARRHLASGNHVGAVGNARDARDDVVIGDRDQVHPARLGEAIHPLHRVVRFAHHARERPDRRVSGMRRVNVGIQLHATSCDRTRTPCSRCTNGAPTGAPSVDEVACWDGRRRGPGESKSGDNRMAGARDGRVETARPVG